MSPLPFAPPPKDSSLYQQLESTTLQTVTADQLDTIRAKTFSQGTEGTEDEYRRLLLLGLASDQLSLSGPISRTMDIFSVELDDKGTAERKTLHTPGAGEVWRCIGLSATWSLDVNPTFVIQVGGSPVYVTMIECTVNATGNTTWGEPLLNEITSTGSREGGSNPDIHYDKDHPLFAAFDYSAGGSITTKPIVSAVCVRVR